MLSENEKGIIKRFIKKLKKEGSTTAGVPGYLTPNAFTGDPDAEGSSKAIGADKAFIIKPSKKKKNFIKIHEISYKNFKQDGSMTEVQKVNKRILEVGRMLREISQALDHSIKLKQESSLDNSLYWKKTNEAIIKINSRVSEITKKARKLANLKELTQASIKEKIVRLFNAAGFDVKEADVSSNQTGNEQYEFDIIINGEPFPVDYDRGMLTYQGFEEEVPLGNLNQQQEVIKALTKLVKR
jgi:hypothetical protein